MKLRALIPVVVLGLGVAACGETDSLWGTRQDGLAHPGPWDIPPDVSAIGDAQYVEYTGAGPWIGEDGCAPWYEPGTLVFRDWLEQAFGQIWHIGGYNCRVIAGTSTTSVHGSGRALDLHIEMDGGDADNDLGDPVGNWLIENAEEIGIQMIIWDKWSWRADRTPGAKGRDYGGVSPHYDHLHIELSVRAGDEQTAWFGGDRELPTLEDCEPLLANGGVVPEDGPCLQLFGPSQYWRFVEGVGHGGSLLWTNAFENDAPSNWARWHLELSAPGDYLVEVRTDPTYGVFSEARYSLRHAGTEDVVYLDQSAAGTWKELGVFAFAADSDEHLSVFDDHPAPVAADQHIVVDAIRLTRVIDDVVPDPDVWDHAPPEVEVFIEDPEDPFGGGGGGAQLRGGCSAAGGAPGAAFGLLLLLGLLCRSPSARLHRR